MQFKHPEILWALFLLLIPIIIHLFQLRRFKKTPFTNVAMLQKVVSESRKSNTLKKWLLLLTRLLLLACLIIAFAQPFFSKATALQEKEMVIYLDDSFSMQAKKDGFTLLEQAVQDLVKVIPADSKFSLFTNENTFKDVELNTIQNKLLALEYVPNQLSYNEVVLKAKTFFSNDSAIQKNLVLISDFQERLQKSAIDSIKDVEIHLVNLKPDRTTNISIDSVYLNNTTKDQIELNVEVSGLAEDESVPISVYNGNVLIAKTAAENTKNQKSTTTFSLPKNKEIKGQISLSDEGLVYDNNFYFNIDKKEKAKVLVVSQGDAGFLRRIYTPEEFDFQNFELKNLNYSEIDKQNLVVLNGLTALPTSLQTILIEFHKNGGSLVVIPAIDMDTNAYNSLLSSLFPFRFLGKNDGEQKITNISFDHPLFENVFEKKVTNFDYPQVKSYWNINSNSSKVLSFSNSAPFLVANQNVFVFTASMDTQNSNFKSAPLIVPVFYNIGVNSLKTPNLYTIIGKNTTIEVAKKIGKDQVLKVARPEFEFIPLQQSFSNKVTLTFMDDPKKDGVYSLMNAGDTLRNLSFNYQREESVLRYLDINNMGASTIQSNIPQVFQKLAKDNSITQYWKWFIIFALVFALLEVLIQKFLA